MREAKRTQRAREIEEAAYGVLERDGYDGLTMLAVARAAKASNETLYRWYGDRTGLFEALIRRNTQSVRDILDSDPNLTAPQILGRVGPALLAMVLGPRAVALNRAAATDSSGKLGQALAQSGRDTVGPWIVQVMQTGLNRGDLPAGEPGDMAETYIALLIGDTQIRRATGAMPEPSPAWVRARADRALELTLAAFRP